MTLRPKSPIVLLALLFVAAVGHAEELPKIPVAFGKWTGPHAGTFKSAVRGGLAKAKGCVVVRPDKARVIIEGTVGPDEKPIKLVVMLKSPQSGEVIESREYTFSKPSPSQAQSSKMGRDVTDMARHAPE